MKNDDTPFSYLVKVGHVSNNPVEVTLSADAEERAGLAKLWSVLEVKALSATFQVLRWKRDGVRIKGRVEADIVQACVVTLDPVDVFGAAARAVDILDAQQERAAGLGGGGMGEQGGMGMAQMQMAGRAGGETGDDHGTAQHSTMTVADRTPVERVGLTP